MWDQIENADRYTENPESGVTMSDNNEIVRYLQYHHSREFVIENITDKLRHGLAKSVGFMEKLRVYTRNALLYMAHGQIIEAECLPVLLRITPEGVCLFGYKNYEHVLPWRKSKMNKIAPDSNILQLDKTGTYMYFVRVLPGRRVCFMLMSTWLKEEMPERGHHLVAPHDSFFTVDIQKLPSPYDPIEVTKIWKDDDEVPEGTREGCPHERIDYFSYGLQVQEFKDMSDMGRRLRWVISYLSERFMFVGSDFKVLPNSINDEKDMPKYYKVHELKQILPDLKYKMLKKYGPKNEEVYGTTQCAVGQVVKHLTLTTYTSHETMDVTIPNPSATRDGHRMRYNEYRGMLADQGRASQLIQYCHENFDPRPYLKHLFSVRCGGNPCSFLYLHTSLCTMIRGEGRRLPYFNLLQGGKQSLKSADAYIFGAAFMDRHKLYLNGLKHVTGHFTHPKLATAQYVFGDEVIKTMDRREMAALRSLITEGVTTAHMKFKDAKQVKTYASYVFTMDTTDKGLSTGIGSRRANNCVGGPTADSKITHSQYIRNYLRYLSTPKLLQQHNDFSTYTSADFLEMPVVLSIIQYFRQTMAMGSVNEPPFSLTQLGYDLAVNDTPQSLFVQMLQSGVNFDTNDRVWQLNSDIEQRHIYTAEMVFKVLFQYEAIVRYKHALERYKTFYDTQGLHFLPKFWDESGFDRGIYSAIMTVFEQRYDAYLSTFLYTPDTNTRCDCHVPFDRSYCNDNNVDAFDRATDSDAYEELVSLWDTDVRKRLSYWSRVLNFDKKLLSEYEDIVITLRSASEDLLNGEQFDPYQRVIPKKKSPYKENILNDLYGKHAFIVAKSWREYVHNRYDAIQDNETSKPIFYAVQRMNYYEKKTTLATNRMDNTAYKKDVLQRRQGTIYIYPAHGQMCIGVKQIHPSAFYSGSIVTDEINYTDPKTGNLVDFLGSAEFFRELMCVIERVGLSSPRAKLRHALKMTLTKMKNDDDKEKYLKRIGPSDVGFGEEGLHQRYRDEWEQYDTGETLLHPLSFGSQVNLNHPPRSVNAVMEDGILERDSKFKTYLNERFPILHAAWERKEAERTRKEDEERERGRERLARLNAEIEMVEADERERQEAENEDTETLPEEEDNNKEGEGDKSIDLEEELICLLNQDDAHQQEVHKARTRNADEAELDIIDVADPKRSRCVFIADEAEADKDDLT